MWRRHVHLSADIPTALRVGRRHGAPVVFAVDTGAMRQAGIPFFLSENGVWLVDSVAPDFVRLLENAAPYTADKRWERRRYNNDA
jgi:putative RNA 2'-phosphotransferase